MELSRAEGCWTFDARDRMPRPSRATAHHLVENAPIQTRAPSRASGFVLRRNFVARAGPGEGPQSTPSGPPAQVPSVRFYPLVRGNRSLAATGAILASVPLWTPAPFSLWKAR